MKPLSPESTHERERGIALDLLAERDTLAGLAHTHRVSIHQILSWKAELLLSLRGLGRSSAA